MTDIKSQSLIYHLTCLANLPSILTQGLLPRSGLQGFTDVADPSILLERQRFNLEDCVPFHFFCRNPFDGRVQKDHRDKKFILLAVKRALARERGWKIIPRHPLAGGNIQIMDYDAGLAAINWQKMNERDYSDPESKSVCMAECIAPGVVPPTLFSNIFVRDENTRLNVSNMVVKAGFGIYVNANEKMFLK